MQQEPPSERRVATEADEAMLPPDPYSAREGTQFGLAFAVLISLLIWGALVLAIVAVL